MKENKKAIKMLKVMFLLATSMLIGYVSASAYSELFIYGPTINIGLASVYFTEGSDTSTLSGEISSTNTTVNFGAISIEPGQTLTYNEAVNITNQAGTTKMINLSLYELTGQFSANFEYIEVSVVATNGTTVGNAINITSSGSNVTSTGLISMPNGAEWAIKLVVKAKATATPSASVSIKLKVRVE